MKRFLMTATVASALFFCGCTERFASMDDVARTGNFTVGFSVRNVGTKAANPDETAIKDINMFVFNEYGVLEHRLFAENYMAAAENGEFSVDLTMNCRYRIYACANLGYAIDASTIQELLSHRHYIAYPDDYRIGIPMSGTLEITTGAGNEISVPLVRLFSRITLQMDRSRLDSGVEMNVRSITAGGCPKHVTPFSPNSITDTDGFFPAGFTRKDGETDMLNTKGTDGKSGTVSLYILENLHGELLPDNTSESKKFFPDGDARAGFCSFVELKIEYLSEKNYSAPGEYLKYRFYIGDSPSNFDVCRNTDYRVIISPSGDGLGEDSWRIVQDGMVHFIESIRLNYTSLTMNYYGQEISLNAYTEPEGIPSDRLMWYSTDEGVATVDGEGRVYARGEGTCSIVCSDAAGGNAFSECKVTVKVSPYYLKLYPGNFIRCRKGDEVSIFCEYFPPSAEFEIGIEELEYDRERGLYDYSVADDGKSVILRTKGTGTGMLYIEAGYPINQAEIVMIVID